MRLTPAEQAARMADLAGGTDVLVRRAGEAQEKGDYRRAAFLADQLITLAKRPKEEGSRQTPLML